MAAANGGGAAGAGGKIRTRRYHLSSGRAPYSRSRQQQQGLISRVTDTVKSIVPAWLQRYFNKEEEVPNRTSNFRRIEDHVDDGQIEEQSQICVQDDLPNHGQIKEQSQTCVHDDLPNYGQIEEQSQTCVHDDLPNHGQIEEQSQTCVQDDLPNHGQIEEQSQTCVHDDLPNHGQIEEQSQTCVHDDLPNHGQIEEQSQTCVHDDLPNHGQIEEQSQTCVHGDLPNHGQIEEQSQTCVHDDLPNHGQIEEQSQTCVHDDLPNHGQIEGQSQTRVQDDLPNAADGRITLEPVQTQEDITVTKTLNLPHLWYVETDRPYNSPENNFRRLTYNLSLFRDLSPSLGRSSGFRSRLKFGDSPFYPGKTTYGGAAAAARTPRLRSTPYQEPIRRQVRPKPATYQSYGVISTTARRILQSLEKMSSPLVDAGVIPALNLQPATFSTHPIANSSFSLVQEFKHSTYVHDDNTSTSSGFSSEASDKDITVTKHPPDRSSETNHPHSSASSKDVSHNSPVKNSRSPTVKVFTLGAVSLTPDGIDAVDNSLKSKKIKTSDPAVEQKVSQKGNGKFKLNRRLLKN